MTDSAERRWWPHKRTAEALANAAWAAGPPLLFGLRMWASVSLALYVAFQLELADPYWASASASIVRQPQVGASLRKGWFRMIGTLAGAVAIAVLTACSAQNRPLFLGGLALWGAACPFVATLLRNFAAYAAALAGYTAAIIAGDELGAIHVGDAATVKLMGHSELIRGRVGSIARGVNVANAQPDGEGLANVNPIFTWVGLAQRIPVRIDIDHAPAGVVLAIGMRATVQIEPQPARPSN